MAATTQKHLQFEFDVDIPTNVTPTQVDAIKSSLIDQITSELDRLKQSGGLGAGAAPLDEGGVDYSHHEKLHIKLF